MDFQMKIDAVGSFIWICANYRSHVASAGTIHPNNPLMPIIVAAKAALGKKSHTFPLKIPKKQGRDTHGLPLHWDSENNSEPSGPDSWNQPLGFGERDETTVESQA